MKCCGTTWFRKATIRSTHELWAMPVCVNSAEASARGHPSEKASRITCRSDLACFATTMVDYYALPQTGPGAWPGRAQSAGRGSTEEQARCVEDAMRDDLVEEMGSSFNSRRFVPFVVMHEFEGLLFSDCSAFSHGIGRPDLEGDFRNIRKQFATPEEMDDSPDTAPSNVYRLSLREASSRSTCRAGDWTRPHPTRMPSLPCLAEPA